MNKLLTAWALVLLSSTFAFANTTWENLTTTTSVVVTTGSVELTTWTVVTTGVALETTGSVELTTGAVVTTWTVEITTGDLELTTWAVVISGSVELTGTVHHMTGECLSGMNFINDSVRTKIHALMITLDDATAAKVKSTLKTMNYNVSWLKAKYVDALSKMYTKRAGKVAIARSEKMVTTLTKYLEDNKWLSPKNTKLLKGIISYATLKLIELKDLSNDELKALLVK